MMMRRLFGSALVLLSILVLPFWFYIPILFIAIVVFPFYWEGILFGFLIDVLYGNGISPVSYGVSLWGLGALIILLALMPFRGHIRFSL